MAYPVATMPDGWTKWSDGTITYENKKKNIATKKVADIPQKPKINLFDFSDLNPVSKIGTQTQKPWVIWWWAMPPTTSWQSVQQAQVPFAKTPIKSPMLPNFSQQTTDKFTAWFKPLTTPIQKSSFNEEWLEKLKFDITNWATSDEIKKFYPEIPKDDKLIEQLQWDITNWATNDEIIWAYPELFWPKQEQPWFLNKIWEDLSTRAKNVWKAAWEENPITFWLYWAWNIIWWVWDIVWRLIWEAYKLSWEPWKEIAQSILNTKVWQEAIQALWNWMESYNEWAKNNLTASRTLEWVVNIASIFPVNKWAQLAWKWIEKTWEAIVKWGKTILKPITEPAKTIIQQGKTLLGKPDEIQGIQQAIKPYVKVKDWKVVRSNEQITNEIKRANELIKQSWDVPSDLATYRQSLEKQLKWLWDQISAKTKQPLEVDLTETSSKLRELASKKTVWLLDKWESQKLISLADDLEKSGKIWVWEAEYMNQFINDTLRNIPNVSETYKRWLNILVKDLREKLDLTLSNIPWEFKQIKKDYWALRNILWDTVKREIVYNRANPEWLITWIWKMEWLWNIWWWILKILWLDVKWWVSDIGKWLIQNRVWTFIKTKNDPNYIIKQIFSNKSKNVNNVNTNIPSTTKNNIWITKDLWWVKKEVKPSILSAREKELLKPQSKSSILSEREKAFLKPNQPTNPKTPLLKKDPLTWKILINSKSELQKKWWFIWNLKLTKATPEQAKSIKDWWKAMSVSNTKKVVSPSDDLKKTIWNWKPTNWWYKVETINISKTNAFPRAKYHKEDYVNTAWYKYWKEQIANWKEITPVVIEKTDKWYYVLDWYHRLAAAEDMWVKNIKAVILDNPVKKWEQAKWLKQFTNFTDKELKDIFEQANKKLK